MTDDNGMKYTKEYIAKVRLCSNLIDPPASDVIGELLDEIEQLTAERDELYNWIIEILELARTGLPLSFMTEEQWASHRLNRIAHIASQAKQETK